MELAEPGLRRKMVVAFAVVALAAVAYTKIVHEPFDKKVKSYKAKIGRFESQVTELKTRFPVLEEQRKKIQALEEEHGKLIDAIKEVEKKLPPKKEASQLVGEFTRLAREAKLLSIRQKTIVKDGYNKIFIEIKLAAPYPAAIAYISRLESISPFLRVEEADINESKGKTFEEGGAPVRVVISSILGEATLEQALRADDSARTPEVKRDILESTAKPVSVLNEKDFKLEGVTFTEHSPTAIINGEVFRVGSEVKGYTVKQILPGSVVMSDGGGDHLLTLNP